MTDPPIPQTKHTLNKEAVAQSELVQPYGLTREKKSIANNTSICAGILNKTER